MDKKKAFEKTKWAAGKFFQFRRYARITVSFIVGIIVAVVWFLLFSEESGLFFLPLICALVVGGLITATSLFLIELFGLITRILLALLGKVIKKFKEAKDNKEIKNKN